MATSISVYSAIDDPLYSVTGQPARIDKDTVYRQANYYSAAVNGTGVSTPAGALNTGKQTIFDVTQGSGSRMRWGTSALRMRMVFADATGAATPPVFATAAVFNSAPAWNLTAQLIRSVKLELNSGNSLYTSSTDHFTEEFTARVIRGYDYEVMNHMGEMLFTPVGSTKYTLTAPAVPADNTTFDPSFVTRGTQYCGTGAQQREITKIIPFTDLFPRMPDAIFKNLRKIKITIEWVNTQDLLDHKSSVATDHAFVYLISADLLTDYYVMSPAQSTIALEEKMKAKTDILPYLNTQVYTPGYTPNSEIIIPSIRNFDSVMIMQLSKGQGNGNGTAANVQAYASNGEFILMGNATTTTAGIRARADDPVSIAGATGQIDSVQISIGNIQYPDQPIATSQVVNTGTSFDPSGIYHEYIKAINRLSDRTVGSPIPFDVFRTTMPFIFLRPFASDAPKTSSEGKDLHIRMRGGQACALSVVVFTYHVHTLSADGVSIDI